MGLERLACVVQDVDSMFDVDTIKALRDHVCRLADKSYGIDHETDVSHSCGHRPCPFRNLYDLRRYPSFQRVVADMSFVVSFAVHAATESFSDIDGAFLVDLANTVIEGSKDGYPELEEKKEFIFNVIAKEEANFNKTIDQGLSILADMEAEMEKRGEKVLSGEDAFRLYDTYGFPIDLTSEILEEKGLDL